LTFFHDRPEHPYRVKAGSGCRCSSPHIRKECASDGALRKRLRDPGIAGGWNQLRVPHKHFSRVSQERLSLPRSRTPLPALKIVEEYYPASDAQYTAEGKELPGYIQQEFEDYLNADAWSMAFCGCSATRVVPNTWWRSVANDPFLPQLQCTAHGLECGPAGG